MDRRAVTDIRPGTRLMRGARAVAVVMATAEAADAGWHLAAGALASGLLLMLACVFFTALALVWTRNIRHARAEAGPVPAVRQQTFAEQMAEAVEERRQRQWDAIAERAYRAAPPPFSPSAALIGHADKSLKADAQPSSGAVELDPRWEWRLVQGFGIPDRYVKVRCLHTEVVDVESGGGVVAQLCTTCDTQFPAPDGNWG